jgi:hypothetical protein
MAVVRQPLFLTISGACKGWIYQDMFEKPNDLLLYRTTEEGGLGMHHVQSKALAGLIVTFLQTAANPRFQQSLYHSLLYRRHCLMDLTAPNLPPPPYYSKVFFETIKDVHENSPLNPVHMTVKEWYRHLVEKQVTMVTVDDEGRMMPRLCKVEEREPQHDWVRGFSLSRLKGFSPDMKSFNFKLLHLILPCKERLNQMVPATSPVCLLCAQQQQESILHMFFGCEYNSEAGKFLINLVKVYDPSITEEKAVRFQIQFDALYELPATLMLYSGLFSIWNNRLSKKRTSIFSTRAELELLIVTLRKSRLRRLREAGSIIQNTLDFLVVA